MFGSHKIPLDITQEGVSLSLRREGNTLRYKRECLGEKVEKTLLTGEAKVLVNPVEPVNKPKELTPYLLIELERVVIAEPRSTQRIYTKFPIEIGVFISKNENFETLDTLTLVKRKFTLYGDPRNGSICKYFRSDVYPTVPHMDPLREGVMELSITNNTTNWVQITKAVFNAYGMKIYYKNDLVSMKANMRIGGSQIAENEFTDSPLRTGMKKSLELYTARRLSITSAKFVMELGL
jgi:hypothetical protein